MSIVVGGVAVALLIGRPDATREAGGPGAEDRITLRRRADSQTWGLAADPRGVPEGEAAAARALPFPASPEASLSVRAQQPDVLPPSLGKSFPSEDLPASGLWSASTGIGPPGAGVAGQTSRVHKIVNGDSLPSLAKRYLGSEDRAGEIFEANRDLLANPDALPIGIELRVPPRDSPKSTTQHPSDPPLVPIRPRSGRLQPETGA